MKQVVIGVIIEPTIIFLWLDTTVIIIFYFQRLIKSMDGCFPTALGRQPSFNA